MAVRSHGARRVSETFPENSASPGVRDLLAKVRENARARLVERLVALSPEKPGNAGVVLFRRFARDLTDRQLADWHVLLDHQEGPQ